MTKKNSKKTGKQAAKKEKGPTKRELTVKFHKEGYLNEEIAIKAGTTVNSVRWYLSKAGLKSNRPKKEKKSQK